MQRMLFILVIAVFGNSQLVWAGSGQAQTPAPGLAMASDDGGGLARRTVGRARDVGRSRYQLGAAAGRPLDRHRRRHVDRPRLADEPRHRRRAGDVAEPAADQRQAAGHDLDVRLGSRRRDPPLRARRPARSVAAERADPSAVSRTRRSPRRATARTSCSPGSSSSKDVAEKAVNLAAGYVDKKEEVVSLLSPCRTGAVEQPGAAARPLRRGQPDAR